MSRLNMSLLEMSLWGGAMTAMLVTLRFFGIKRLPKRIMPFLWCIVLVRLLIPMRFVLQMPPTMLPSALPPAASQIALGSETLAAKEATLSQQVFNAVGNALQGAQHVMPAFRQTNQSAWGTVWCIGMCLAAVFLIALRLYWHGKLSECTPLLHGETLSSCRPRKPIRRTVQIYQCNGITSPMTTGFLHPKIYLPKGLPSTALQHVLLHEWMHIRCGDALKKQLMMLALCVHWFNPLVWVMVIVMNRDLELACDERVLHILGQEEAAPYAATLLALAKRQAMPSFITAFAKGSIEERMVNLLKPQKKTWAGTLALILSISCCAFAFSEAQRNWRDTVKAYVGTLFEDYYVEGPDGEVKPLGIYGGCLYPTEEELTQMIKERGLTIIRPANLPADIKVTSIEVRTRDSAYTFDEDDEFISQIKQGEPEVIADGNSLIHRWEVPASYYENFDTIRYLMHWSDRKTGILDIAIISVDKYKDWLEQKSYTNLVDFFIRLQQAVTSGERGDVLPNELCYHNFSMLRPDGLTSRKITAVSKEDVALLKGPSRDDQTIILYTISGLDIPEETLLDILANLK